MALEIKGSRARKRRGTLRSHRQFATGIALTITSVLLLVVIGGAAYIWYIGQSEPVVPASFPEAKQSSTPQLASQKPKGEPTGPVGVSSQVFSSPVAQGGNASLTIRTRAGAACSITVTYKDQKSTDTGLLPKTADEFGTVQWTWTVETSRPQGKWPVEVTCGLGEESGYLKLELEVQAAVN